MAYSSERFGSFRLRTGLDFANLRSRLRSEFGPAAQAESEIVSAVADVDKDLADCDDEVLRLQSRIIHLRNQQVRLKEYKKCLRALTSPIRKLPNEILVRIFDYTCDMNEISSRKLKKMPALALSGVCSRWRSL